MKFYGPYLAVVLSLHDGDTMKLDLDLGFGIHQTALSCRIYGINAPELSTDAGKAAFVFAQSLVKPGDLVTVTSYGWDKYGGRFDGRVILNLHNFEDYAELMVASGHAVRI